MTQGAIAAPGDATMSQVANINPGGSNSDPQRFVVTPDGTVLFAATDDATGAELYKSALLITRPPSSRTSVAAPATHTRTT